MVQEWINDLYIKFYNSNGGHFVLAKLTLKLIFQLGNTFFQIQHIQFMKNQL